MSLHIDVITTTTLTISWTPNSGDHYTVNYIGLCDGDGVQMNTSTKESRIKLNKLIPGTDYLITVYANSKGVNKTIRTYGDSMFILIYKINVVMSFIFCRT